MLDNVLERPVDAEDVVEGVDRLLREIDEIRATPYPTHHINLYRFFSGEIEDTLTGYALLRWVTPHLTYAINWRELRASDDRASFITEEMVDLVPVLRVLRPDLGMDPVDLVPFDEEALKEARQEAKRKSSKVFQIYKRILSEKGKDLES